MSDIQSVIDVLRGVDLDVNAPISKVRKLADEYMKSSIEVRMQKHKSYNLFKLIKIFCLKIIHFNY